MAPCSVEPVPQPSLVVISSDKINETAPRNAMGLKIPDICRIYLEKEVVVLH